VYADELWAWRDRGLWDAFFSAPANLSKSLGRKPTTLEVINAMPISEAATGKRLDRARTKGLLDGVPQGKEVVWAAKVKE